MNKISIVISAYNEEKKIELCLKSALWADEVIVVDNDSTDKTVEIAKKYTKHVYHQKNDPNNIDLQKNYGIEKATGEWIFILDADEVVTTELAEEIKNVLNLRGNDKGPNGYWIPRKNISFGKWIEHTGWYPDYQLRFFKKGKGKYIAKHYHEPIRVEGDKARLINHLVHYNYETIAQFLYKGLLVYAPNEAEERIRNGYTFDYLDAIRLPFNEFLSRYFAREGYKDGFHGLMLSILSGMYHFAVFAYLWEKNKFVDNPNQDLLKSVEKEIKKSKKEVLYWWGRRNITDETNLIKKVELRVKKKLHL